jgi:hypothetical protein
MGKKQRSKRKKTKKNIHLLQTGLNNLRELGNRRELLKVLDQHSINVNVPKLDGWLALILNFIRIHSEFKKKGPDDLFADTLLKLIRTADDERRSGKSYLAY